MAFTTVQSAGRQSAGLLAPHSTTAFRPRIRDGFLRDAIIAADGCPACHVIGAKQAAHLCVNHSAWAYAATDAASGRRARLHTPENVHSSFTQAIIVAWQQISRGLMGRHSREGEFGWHSCTGHQPRLVAMFSGASGLLSREALLA